MSFSDMMVLPNGSACCVASSPLPKDHWIYAEPGDPPMGLRMGASEERTAMVEKVREAAQYAVRGATMSGTATGFDPDALVQNMIVGLLGYYTVDGR